MTAEDQAEFDRLVDMGRMIAAKLRPNTERIARAKAELQRAESERGDLESMDEKVRKEILRFMYRVVDRKEPDRGE